MSFSEQDLEEFKAEALELLDVAEKSLLTLDQGAEFKSAFDAIFRGFHNLKGAAGMMELAKLQAHTHELENILMGFKGANEIPKEYISLFLRGIDAAKILLENGEVQFDYSVSSTPASNEKPPVQDKKSSEIRVEVKEEQSPIKQELPKEALNEFFVECEEIVERISKCLQSVESGDFSKNCVDGLYRDIHSLKGSAYLFSYTKLGDLAHAMESSLEKVRAGTHVPSKALLNGLFKSLMMIERLVQAAKTGVTDDDAVAEASKVAAILHTVADRLEQVSETAQPSAKTECDSQKSVVGEAASAPRERETDSTSSIRVPVALLDNLMTLMGEMVLVRNQVLQFSSKSEDLEFLSMSKRLNVVTSEIQGEMMKTRMQPIGNVLGKFNRVVRDLSQELGKKISLNLFGTETELDKSLLEAIKDPLTHIVRNSCDHGIETPDVRRAAGKPDGGTINIKAYHEGGQVIIEIQDDGKGLNRDALLKKAVEKGLVNPAEVVKLSEKQIFNLIFAPGFSTAAKVTNVSGRGVGMDVVRTNIERIGGAVDLSSVAGSGTSIKIKIPLTLAIVPALTVKCSGGTFAIPQVKLEELVRVDQSSAQNKIECLHGAPVLRLRGNILPLIDLNKILKVGHEMNYKDGIVNIAVLNAEQSSFGLIIDQVQDTVDIVVKPLNRLLKSLQAYSGATILGDGSVALILDVLGLSKLAHVGHERIGQLNLDDEKNRHSAEAQDYLLVKVASPTKHAIVLGYVYRLEEFKGKDIEYSGSQRVVRYGNTILPLISVNKEIGYDSPNQGRELVPTVVIRRAGFLYGLEVDGILDTLSSAADLDSSHIKNPGIFGNLNTTEELIVVVDPFELIESSFPGQSKVQHASLVSPEIEAVAPPVGRDGESPTRILVAEDTIFFRKAIKALLEKAGYEVTTVADGQEAIDLLNQNENIFDLIISDIEMPRVNGFQLAKAIRNHPKLSSVPLLAVSSRADSSFMSEGKRAGFNLYMEKLKPNMFLNAVAELITKEKSAA